MPRWLAFAATLGGPLSWLRGRPALAASDRSERVRARGAEAT